MPIESYNLMYLKALTRNHFDLVSRLEDIAKPIRKVKNRSVYWKWNLPCLRQ